MNKDITTMIELQKYWDNVLKERNLIKRSEDSITRSKNDINIKTKELNALDETIKKIKININEKEVELSEIEDHLKKLEIKKNAVKTEKEVNAVEHEFEKARSNKEKIEEDLIILYDEIEIKDKTYVLLKKGFDEQEQQSVVDIEKLQEIISKSQNLEQENNQKFDEKILDLSQNVKSRFLKFINSQNGKGIAKIDGEICGACNFQIPFNLIQDLSKEKSIIICTNCGRYIYKSPS